MQSELLAECLDLWRGSPAGLPELPRTFRAEEQAACEAHLDRFLAAIQAELQHVPATRGERETARERITAAFVEFARTALGMDEAQLDLLLGGGLSAIGTELGRQARRFDAAVSTADILQASRNAWTACGLQMLFGRAMRLTPSIFAYSMLYPYTDNYLDDPGAAAEAKLGFSARFGRRLAGEDVAPANAREEAIWKLAGMIEGEYSRPEWPEVYASLAGIHRAQENSIRLLRRGRAGERVDVLTLSFEKGGASVLADGYLAAGTLSREQARFVFGWGVLLQLADDLQDVEQDCRDGVLTVFSEMAGRAPLDQITSRTIHFGRRVMAWMHAVTDGRPLKDLIERSSLALLIRSAGEAGSLYTKEYLAELERHSPFRFGFLNERREQFARRRRLMVRLFEAFLEGEEDEPAFPWLPSSLMPRG